MPALRECGGGQCMRQRCDLDLRVAARAIALHVDDEAIHRAVHEDLQDDVVLFGNVHVVSLGFCTA